MNGRQLKLHRQHRARLALFMTGYAEKAASMVVVFWRPAWRDDPAFHHGRWRRIGQIRRSQATRRRPAPTWPLIHSNKGA
jgi:hypothetical protein